MIAHHKVQTVFGVFHFYGKYDTPRDFTLLCHKKTEQTKNLASKRLPN